MPDAESGCDRAPARAGLRKIRPYPPERDQLFGGEPGAFGRRVQEVEFDLGSEAAQGLWEVGEDEGRELDRVRDALSTRLMELFRVHQSRTCFGLLYELNSAAISLHVAQRLRRYHSRADAGDLLQEVFFNIYRYPSRFDCSRDDAFRVWTATIVRNTVLKHLRSLSRSGRAEVPFEDLSEQPETGEIEPLGGVIQRESEGQCQDVFVLYLHLYLQLYRQLSEREQRALHLVEVEGVSYREAAADLQIKLENLKMVIFRARRKIHRAMRRVFEGSPPEMRRPRKSSTAKANSSNSKTAKAAAAGVSVQGTSYLANSSKSTNPDPATANPRERGADTPQS